MVEEAGIKIPGDVMTQAELLGGSCATGSLRASQRNDALSGAAVASLEPLLLRIGGNKDDIIRGTGWFT